MTADEELMALAIAAAADAAARGEVPVGAVLAIADRPIVSAGNEREATRDPTAHAELLCLRRGALQLGRWRLSDATLYVTLEPCPMCMGALVNARVARLVYGALDPKAGAAQSLFRLGDDPRLNHRMAIDSGLGAELSGALLSAFFRGRRVERRRVRDSNSR